MNHLETRLAHDLHWSAFRGVGVSSDSCLALRWAQVWRGGRFLCWLVIAQQLGGGSVASSTCTQHTQINKVVNVTILLYILIISTIGFLLDSFVLSVHNVHPLFTYYSFLTYLNPCVCFLVAIATNTQTMAPKS